MHAPRKLPTMTEIPDSDADATRRCACNRKRANSFLTRHWFDTLTTVLFLAFAIVITQIEGADDAANVWWVVAVAIGAWPVSRIVELALQQLFRTVVTPLMAWYLGVLWQRLPVWLWCSSMIAVLRRKPVDGEEYMESLCWLAIIITVVRAVVRLATRVLQHMVAQKASPQKKRALARALMLLADLYHRSQQSGSHTVDIGASGLPVSHSCSSISSLASAGAATEGGADKSDFGALASSGDEKAVPVLPPPVPVSNTQAFEAMLARNKPSDRPTFTRSLSGGDRPTDGVDVPASSATLNKTSGPVRRLASIAKSLRATRSAARQGRPRKPKIPPVANNQALFEEYVDLMDEDEPQIQTLSRLFYYIQKGVPSMVVNFRALRKLLCREDATVLASQLALFKTAFTKEEFVSAAAFVFKSWAKQSQPPSHKQNYTWVLTALVDTLLAISAPFLFMLLLGVNPVTVLVPVGSSLLAASFMFAPSAQAFIQCLTFVLVQHPFDKDDVVVIDKVPYRVDKVSLMTSAMVNYITNARTYMPNVVLATKTIVNAQRSQHAYANVDVYVDGDITQAQVDQLNEVLKDYMSNEARSDWLQPADPLIYLNGTNPTDGKLWLSVWAATWIPWPQRRMVFNVQLKLVIATTKALRQLGVKYDRAPHRVEMMRGHDSYLRGLNPGATGGDRANGCTCSCTCANCGASTGTVGTGALGEDFGAGAGIGGPIVI